MPLALTYVAAVCEGTGVAPGAADATVSLINILYGAVFGLFFVAALCPLIVALLTEKGPTAALLTPLKNVLCGSPLFFILQSRCIGHYFSGEFAMGGAGYIPTGRSLAIQHQPFHTLYASFAESCTYPGLELAFFIVGLQIGCPGIELRLFSYIFPWVTPAGLLFGLALFNPRSFELQVALGDVRLWARWLLDPSAKGWLYGFHRGIVRKKGAVRSHSFLLPSKEMLLALPLLLISYEAMTPFGWGATELAVVGAPLLPLCLVSTLLLVWRACWACWRALHRGRRDTSTGDKMEGRGVLRTTRQDPANVARLTALCAAVCAATFVGELVVAVPSELPARHAVALLGARYFCWRALANLGAYVNVAVAQRRAEAVALPARLLFGLLSALEEGVSLTVAALALLADVLLGLGLQLPVLLLAGVPVLSDGLHFLCLFGTRRSVLTRGIIEQQSDRAALSPSNPRPEPRRPWPKAESVRNLFGRGTGNTTVEEPSPFRGGGNAAAAAAAGSGKRLADLALTVTFDDGAAGAPPLSSRGEDSGLTSVTDRNTSGGGGGGSDRTTIGAERGTDGALLSMSNLALPNDDQLLNEGLRELASFVSAMGESWAGPKPEQIHVQGVASHAVGTCGLGRGWPTLRAPFAPPPHSLSRPSSASVRCSHSTLRFSSDAGVRRADASLHPEDGVQADDLKGGCSLRALQVALRAHNRTKHIFH